MVMPIKQIPNRCIWCLREPPSATFNSESHVLPECVGNKRQQVLLPGIVCDDCNSCFGGKVEGALIDDPIFGAIVGVLQLRDKKSEFVYEHSPSGVHRIANMEAEVSPNRVNIVIKYEITGQPDKPNDVRVIEKSKDYDSRALALLSRAVHKLAFESLAHSLFVKSGLKFEHIDLKNIDIFDSRFNSVRKWVRYGKPQRCVRSVLRLQKFDEIKTQEELFQWGGELRYFQQWFRYELNLFGDWYIMSLTSPAYKVDGDLRSWAARTKFTQSVWMVGNKLYPLSIKGVKGAPAP